MMILLSLIAPLWHPVKEQLCLIRALATGDRIPGTNLILMPADASGDRFGVMEHMMMVLAGGWLLFRVICCKLVDEDKLQPRTQKNLSKIPASDSIKSKNKEIYYREGRQRFRHTSLWKMTREDVRLS